ncbi:disulfide bond formation protein DsbA [Nocardioides dongxiaopingii]|uniref:DsbA family protein n=1 Tax=Nocardioides sp. S-1144 TaxID=2582905 RepID=UPI00110E91B0|nr:thioredoxin domain-containing protein [Nocardioides sp. S-1144]QCW49944.1 disulfide bond formation protein DsbA [Nocardioides sp. S-1144]
MAGKSKTEARAEQRAARLAEIKKAEQAAARRRNLMVGGVVALVLVLIAVVIYFFSRSNDVEAAAPGSSDYGVTIGPEDAPHTLVIYEDFLCPACGALEAATGDRLAELADEGQVFVDYRPFTLLDRLGTYSARSASAFGVVLEESGPEVAKKFHDLLYAEQPEEGAEPYPDADWLVDKAVEAGADEDAVRPGIEEGENDFAEEATQEAVDAGVQGTPTVILDGETFTGGYDELLEKIEN